MKIEPNNVYCGNCLDILKTFPDDCIDLTVTSPPYDDLRTYKGYTFDFKGIAKELHRVTKYGGVVVWVVNDATIKGSETGTSFTQALYFKEIGFNLHDTMIWSKCGFSSIGSYKTRYHSIFDYMFIFTKGKIATFNPINDIKCKYFGKRRSGTRRQKNGTTRPRSRIVTINEYGKRYNIWEQCQHRQTGGHPAPFPEQLANDHIISWSNEGDIVLDPFAGSGTTLKMAIKNNRKYIGIEISPEYCEMIRQRLSESFMQPSLW